MFVSGSRTRSFVQRVLRLVRATDPSVIRTMRRRLRTAPGSVRLVGLFDVLSGWWILEESKWWMGEQEDGSCGLDRLGRIAGNDHCHLLIRADSGLAWSGLPRTARLVRSPVSGRSILSLRSSGVMQEDSQLPSFSSHDSGGLVTVSGADETLAVLVGGSTGALVPVVVGSPALLAFPGVVDEIIDMLAGGDRHVRASLMMIEAVLHEPFDYQHHLVIDEGVRRDGLHTLRLVDRQEQLAVFTAAFPQGFFQVRLHIAA